MKKVLSILTAVVLLATTISVSAAALDVNRLSNLKDCTNTTNIKTVIDSKSCGNLGSNGDVIKALNQKCVNGSICSGKGCTADKSCVKANTCANTQACKSGACPTQDIASKLTEALKNCKNTDISKYLKNIIPKGTDTAKPATPTTPTKPATPATPATPSTPTTPTTPATPATPTTGDNAAFIAEVVRLVNVERAKAGLSAVTSDDANLQAAAQVRAQETATSFSHTRPNGQSCFTVLGEKGVSYRGAGENIAMGQTTPAEVMNGWMNSEGHRANILNSNFKKIGVGCYRDANGRYYWSQMFVY